MNEIFKNELEPKPKSQKETIIWIALIVILLVTIIFTPIFKSREIVITGKNAGNNVINLGKLGLIFPSGMKNKARVNLLFLGIPGENNSAPELTDSIIIINSDPKGKNPIGISIPRDLFVRYENYYTKINSLYKRGGIELITTAIYEVTGLEMDYFIVLDLQGVEKIIDRIDGIDVYVEEDIHDTAFPGPNNTYEVFSIDKGNQHLDGKTAIKYIRTRHQPGGDFSRIKRQQQVTSALKDKIFSLSPIWNMATVLNIWNTLNKHTYTNIGITDLRYAWNLAKKTDFNEIEFYTLSNQPNEEQLLVSAYVNSAYILKPRAGINNYEEIKKYINEIIQ